MPAGSTLQVLQDAVDYAGQNGLTATTSVIGAYPAARLASGAVTQAVGTTADSFLRTLVVSSAGALIVTSNPIWLLRKPPPNGSPARAA